MKPVNYALIGFGGIAENRIAKEGFACVGWRDDLPEANLIGATDVNPARREAVAAMGLRWYESLDAVLADPAVDAVFIATNNLTHAAVAKRAMQAGHHVLVEKPMATDCRDAEELCALARAGNLSLGMDHMMIENAYNRKAREMVADGVLGTVNDARFHMEFLFGSTPEEAESWRCSKTEEMGGPIGDVASHCFYVAEFIFNSRIAELACVYYPKIMEIRTENGAYIAFRLASGVTGSVQVSFCSPRGGVKATLDNLGYEIFGEHAVLRGHGTLFQMSGSPEDPVPVRLELDRFVEREDIQVDHIENMYQRVIQKHARSILENKPMDGRDGVHNLRLIEAAHASARGGGVWVGID